MLSLSIIVPIYNVEKYVHSCLESIFRQGMADETFEVILVNDGTTDRSMEMITDIISQHDNIIVINQENLSLSVARNNGIAAAKGEYILMPDSDDLLLENSLGLLLEKALETKPDLIVADFLEMSNDEIENFQGVIQNETTFKEKTGEQLFLEDLNPYQCYVWRTLFRKEFLVENKLIFVPGIHYQDVPFTHECYIKAKKCLRTHLLLNIYRRRAGSATWSFDKKRANDYCIVIGKTWNLIRIENLSEDVLLKIKNDVYTTFSLFIYSILHTIKGHSARVNIIRFLNKLVPDLYFSHGIKQRIESFLFKNFPHLYIFIRELHWIWIHH